MVIKSTEGFLIKFCAFRRRSVSGGEERNVSNYEKNILKHNNYSVYCVNIINSITS